MVHLIERGFPRAVRHVREVLHAARAADAYNQAGFLSRHDRRDVPRHDVREPHELGYHERVSLS